nr:uroporphyrinogen-III synthase [Moraxella sp. CTOTU48268]
MQFINTRPDQRAKALSLFLRQHGVKVIDLPLLALVEKPLTVAERAVLQSIDRYQVVVLVSEAAVKYGLARLTTLVKLTEMSKKIVWVAVGDKTANYFNQTWQQLSELPAPTVIFPHEKHAQNNEGLLNLPVIQALGTGDCLQVWRGIGGRELLADTLAAKGVQVHLLNFYQRVLPSATTQAFAVWQQTQSHNQPIVVLISSLTAWQNWQQLTADNEMVASCYYLVLQSRIAEQMLLQQANLNITIIPDLMPATILQALTPCQ